MPGLFSQGYEVKTRLGGWKTYSYYTRYKIVSQYKLCLSVHGKLLLYETRPVSFYLTTKTLYRH